MFIDAALIEFRLIPDNVAICVADKSATKYLIIPLNLASKNFELFIYLFLRIITIH